MIDLHLHTTASDGRCTPHELVERASQAALTVIAVTDHDTTAAIGEVTAAARDRGIETISGIEVTAVDEGRDLHVLGYFFDPLDPALVTLLTAQRAARLARVKAIAARLAALGMPIDIEALVRNTGHDRGHSIGRPQVARAMVACGHVADTREAFDRWLGHRCPAFVARTGPSPVTVIEVLHAAGGIASLAHPGKLGLESRVGPLAAAGLDAVEAFHPDHDAALVARYVQIARERNLLLTGGSDFHGDPGHGLSPGSVTLPRAEFDRLRAGRVHASR